MATEGLLAVTCRHGTLHLAEDVIRFEFEQVGDLVAPVISSFTRHQQIVSRYRMNDLLRLSDKPCPCGSPLRAVAEVVGRKDDFFRFPGTQITPDILRNAILHADRGIADFRLVQLTPETLQLTLPECTTLAQQYAAADALAAVLARHGASARIVVPSAMMETHMQAKLRRVESRVVRDG